MASITRRKFIQKGVLSSLLLANYEALSDSVFQSVKKRKLYIFSKHLQWLDYGQMADFISECGFNGADITVRPDGHVEPQRVEDDLPRVVEALRKEGKEVNMITTAILNASEPNTERILRTAGQLGIGCYRPGWHKYDRSKSIDENLKVFEKDLRELGELNEKYKIKASYQNHAGTSLGSPVWDIGQLLHRINSPWIGCQYDVRHATVEGGNSWPLGFEYVKPYINTLDVKDFQWVKEKGKWTVQNVPLGEGMVDFDKYFELISTLAASVPMCLHMEYPMGGAEHGNRKIDLSPEVIKGMMMKEIAFIRERM